MSPPGPRPSPAAHSFARAMRQQAASMPIRQRNCERRWTDARTIGHPIHEGNVMPTIRVELMEGRTVEQKRALAQALTQACVETLDSKPEAVDVLLFDIKRHDWATG